MLIHHQDPVFDDFKALFSREDVTEPEIQAFMEQNTQVIPTPLMLGHDLQWNSVVSQFEITRSRIADFAFITKNSGHWRFVFIEMERPQKRLFKTTPYIDFHHETRDAIAQIEDWKSYADMHQAEIIQGMRLLMRHHTLADNPVEFRYVLIIGRNSDGEYPSQEHSGRIRRLAEESGISLFTFDSILRMGTSHNVGSHKNVLKQSGHAFRFLTAQSSTGIFSSFNPDQIQVSPEQVSWFASQGYDIETWLRGGHRELNRNGFEHAMGRFKRMLSQPNPVAVRVEEGPESQVGE